MSMRIIDIFVMIPFFCACEKVWEADLREKALDTIRGIYEIESAVWEGQDPLDINGDGNATFDYYSEYLSIDAGTGDYKSYINNKSASIMIPIISRVYGYNGSERLIRDRWEITGYTNVLIEGESARVEMTFEKNIEFKHTGYGEFIVRTDITVPDNQGRDSTAPVLMKFIRVNYLGK